jgi:hypothetical protein
MLIMATHFPPFLDEMSIVKSNIANCFEVLAVVFTIKLLSILDLLYHHSPLNTNKGRFVGSLSRTKLDTPFLMKAWIKSYPLITLPVAIFLFLLSGAYLLYVLERGESYTTCYEDFKESHNNNFKNSFWFTVISYYTVGYGDYFPMTIPGRIVNSVIIFGGMTSSAIIIGLVHDHMQLTMEETHVFRFIKTRRKEQLRKDVALKMIVRIFRMKVIY